MREYAIVHAQFLNFTLETTIKRHPEHYDIKKNTFDSEFRSKILWFYRVY